MPNFAFCGERDHEHKTTTLFFLPPDFDTAFKNSTPERIANIWRTERDGISAISLKQRDFAFKVAFS